MNLIIPRDVPNIRVNCKIFSCINSIRKNFNYNSVRKKKNWKILDEGCVMFPSLEGIQLSKATAITLPYSLLDLFLTRININLRYSPFSYYRFFSVHTVERCLNDSKLNGIALISHLFYTWTRGQFVNTFTIRSIHLFHSVFLFFFTWRIWRTFNYYYLVVINQSITRLKKARIESAEQWKVKV